MKRNILRASNLSTVFAIVLLLSGFSNAQSSIQEGIDLFESNKYSEARSFFKKELKSDKKNPEANFYMGRVYFDEEEYGKAIEWFKKAAKFDKNSSKYYMWLGHSYGRLAQNASKIKQPFHARNSRKNYEKAVKMDPENIDARESLIEFYLQAPGFMGGGSDKALVQANEIMKLDKFSGYMSLGRVYGYTKKINDERENYKQALNDFPDDERAYNALINFHYRQKEYGESQRLLDEMIEKKPGNLNAYLSKGAIYQEVENFDAAIQVYDEVLKFDSTGTNVFYQIGRVAAISGNHLEKGEGALRQYISFGEEEIGEFRLAWAHFRLGTIYEHKNSQNEAKKEYQEALKVQKDHKEAKEALKRLN